MLTRRQAIGSVAAAVSIALASRANATFGMLGGAILTSSMQAATPTFSPAGGSYGSTQTVTINCSTSGSTIYYTTDGSTPTTSSSVYSTALSISTTTTVKAIATASGYTQSAVGSATYTIGTVTFNYFVSPTGDDNNAGTLVSPWSITALNSKQSTYAGKNIGFLPGTYQYGTVGGVQTTLYSLFQAAPGTGNPIIAIQGGTSGTPTYIASCNSSGVYAARGAIIDCSNPSGGAQPTVAAAIMGQTTYMTDNVTQYGYVTIDGLVIRNFTFAALMFYGAGGSLINNVTIQNCEIYNGQNVVSNNNPGAIWLDFPANCQVTNCKIHDLQSNGSGSPSTMQHAGVIQFNQDTAAGAATNVTNCTFYNCYALSNKDGHQQLNVSYCYLGFGTFGSPGGTNSIGTVQNYLTGSGKTVNFHHNIVLGPVAGWAEDNLANQGQVNIYNNTFYLPSSSTQAGGLCAFTDYDTSASGGSGNFDFYNNLIWSNSSPPYQGVSMSNDPGAITKLGASGGGTQSTWTANYNAYGTGMTFGYSYTSGQYALSLATWQGFGYDANSVTVGSNPFTGTPTEAEYTTFAISPSSNAYTAGVGGAICGAVDGSGPIGSNF